MQGFSFENAHTNFKKAFKKHHDPLFKTIQSKPVLINGESYVLVGENRIQKFPLISHFDVFDAQGNSGSEEIGRSVHALISQILITESIRSIQLSLQEPTNSDPREFDEVVDAQIARSEFEKLTHQVDRIQRNEQIDEEDIYAVHVAWDAFWELYSPRVQILMQTYEAQKLEKSTSLLEEATTVHALYQSLLYINGFPHIDSVIEDNYMNGRLRQQDAALETPNKGERKMYSVFIVVFRLVFAFAALIVLALLFDGESIVDALIPVAIPLGASAIVRGQSKSRLLSKSNTYYSELRIQTEKQFESSEASTATTSEVHEEKQATSREQQQETIHYETRAIVLDYLIVIGIFALVAFATAIYIYFEGGLGMGPVFIMALIGIGFVLVMILLSLTPLVKQRIVITDQTIYLRKERISMLEVKRIVAKPNGRNIQIFVNYHDSPHRIRMMSGDEEKVTAVLQTWSENNRVSFENQTK